MSKPQNEKTVFTSFVQHGDNSAVAVAFESIDARTLFTLSTIEHFYSSIDFGSVRADLVSSGLSQDEASQSVRAFKNKEVPAILAGTVAAKEFLQTEDYKKLSEYFPDAPQWFFSRFCVISDTPYLIVARTVTNWLHACIPVIPEVMLKTFPKWKPGDVSFYDVMPDLSQPIPASPLLDAMLSAAGIDLNQQRETVTTAEPDEMSKALHKALSLAPSMVTSMRLANTAPVGKLGLAFETPGKPVKVPFTRKKVGKGKDTKKMEVSSNIMVEIPDGATIDHSFGEFDLSVIDAVHSLYASQLDRPLLCGEDAEAVKSLQVPTVSTQGQELPLVVFTATSLWKLMNGETEASKNNNEAKVDHVGVAVIKKIESVLDMAQIASIHQDRTDVLKLLGKDKEYKSGYSKDKILHLREIGLQNYDGNTTRVFQLISHPILLKQAYETGQAVPVPIEVYKIFKTEWNEKQKKLILCKSKYSNTMQRTVIKRYLIQRIVQIKRGARSNKIRMDSMYERCDMADATRSQRKNAREYAVACLDYWATMDPPWIAGYAPNFTGKQNILESVTVKLPKTDISNEEELPELGPI